MLFVAFLTYAGSSHGAKAALHGLLLVSAVLLVVAPSTRLAKLGRPGFLVFIGFGGLATLALGLLPTPSVLGRVLSPAWDQERGAVSWDWMSLDPGATVSLGFEWLLPIGILLLSGASRLRARSLVPALGVGLALLLVVGGSHGFLGLTSLFGVGDAVKHGHFFAPFINDNHFGTAVVLVFPVVLAASMDGDRSKRVVYGFLAGAAFGVTVLAGAVTPVAILVLMSLVVLGRRQPIAALVSAIVGGLGVLAVLLRDYQQGSGQITLHGRIPIWMDSLWMARDHWAMGTGGGTFKQAIEPYRTDLLFNTWTHAHNDWLEWLLETGLVGGIAIGVLAVAARPRPARTKATPREVTLGRMVLLGLLGVWLHAWVDFPMHIPAIALACAALYGWRESAVARPLELPTGLLRLLAALLVFGHAAGVGWEMRAREVDKSRLLLTKPDRTPQDARAGADRLALVAPWDPLLLLHRVEKIEDPKEAAVALDGLERAHRRDSLVMRRVALQRRRLTDNVGERRAADLAVAFGPSDWRNWLVQAESRAEKDPVEAARICGRALVSSPQPVRKRCWSFLPVGSLWVDIVEDLPLHTQVAMCTFILKERELDAALLCYQGVRLQDPSRFPLGMGEALAAIGRMDDSVTFLEQGLAARPTDTKLMRKLAHSYEQQGEDEKALLVWTQLAKHKPQVRLHRIRSIDRVSGPATALETLEKARLKGDPLRDAELDLKADLERRLGRPTACIRTLSMRSRSNMKKMKRAIARCSDPD